MIWKVLNRLQDAFDSWRTSRRWSGTICNRRTVGVVVDKLPHSGASVWSAPTLNAPVGKLQFTMVNVAEQNVINKNFAWEQADQSNLIRIHDADDDLIAEYSRSSGAVRWKRAASAVDKNVIERFLADKFGEEVRRG